MVANKVNGTRAKTFAGSGAIRNSSLDPAIRSARSRGAGQDGVLAAPSPGAMRKFIEAQQCPWCDSGPWKVLAGHTHKSHGVSGAELREMAEMVKTASICAPGHSATAAARGKERASAGLLTPLLTSDRSRRRVMSAAGRAAQRAKSLGQTAERRERAAAVMVATKAAANSGRDQQVIALFDQGLLLTQIAEQMSISPITVKRVVRAVRGDGDLLARRTGNERWRTATATARTRAHESRVRAIKAENARICTEFADRGGGWAALCGIAADCGVSVGSMRARLRALGVTVPDGRRASPLMGRRRNGSNPG